jgi:simple sugar transport system substrate-binding protein
MVEGIRLPRLRRRGERKRNLTVLAVVAVLLTASGLTACSKSATDSASSGSTGSTGSAFPGGTSLKGKTALMVIYTAPLSAWNPSLNAVKAVEAATGLKIDVQYANNNPQTEIQQIQTGISRKVDAMALQITSTAVASAVCDATKAGIPVVAWNQNALTGSQASCVQATMEQSSVAAGEVIAQYMIKNGPIKQGDRVFCPVEDPTATYASERAQGIKKALAAVGATCDVLATGDADADAKTKMVQYLLGHKDTSAIIAMGGIPLANAAAALTQVGMKIPVGGFDVYDPRIPKAIKAGQILGVVDQQFYSQAYYAGMQLALELQYGLAPSDMNTGGKGVVDKSNVATILELSGKYR